MTKKERTLIAFSHAIVHNEYVLDDLFLLMKNKPKKEYPCCKLLRKMLEDKSK